MCVKKVWERERERGRGVVGWWGCGGVVLGSEGGKRNRGQWKQRSRRPRGQAAWCPQSPGRPCVGGAGNGPACIIAGVRFVRECGTEYIMAPLTTRTIDHVFGGSPSGAPDSAGTSGRLTRRLLALAYGRPPWPPAVASTISLIGSYRTAL